MHGEPQLSLTISHGCRIESTMLRLGQQALVGSICALAFSISMAQESPTLVTVGGLSKNPLKFDGRLVRLRAWLSYGWEGDNFLYDKPRLVTRNKNPKVPAVWFDCKPDHYQLCGTIRPVDREGLLGWFTGYFHFVPKTHIVNGAFDPGPLQLEVVEVSLPGPQTQ